MFPNTLITVLQLVPLDIRVQDEQTGASRCRAPGVDWRANVMANLKLLHGVSIPSLYACMVGFHDIHMCTCIIIQLSNAKPLGDIKSMDRESLISNEAAWCSRLSLKAALVCPFPAKYSTIVQRLSSFTLDVKLRRITIPRRTLALRPKSLFGAEGVCMHY